MRPVVALIVALFVATTLPSPSAPQSSSAEAQSARPAIVIEHDSLAESQIVAIDRDVVIRGRAMSNVAAIRGSIEVSGHVQGDVIALGGDVRLEPGARIDGDVLVLGGVVESLGDATIEGRTVAYPSASGAWLVLAEGPALGLSAWSPVVLGAKLALLAAWTVVMLVLVVAASPALAATSSGIAEEPLRSFATGVVAVLTLLLTALFFASFLNALVGVPLVAIVVLTALILKLWGMVAIFCWIGGVTRRTSAIHQTALLHNALVGLVVLGAVKLLPFAGALIWTVATLVGIGASLTTKFGRREAWFVASSSAS